MKKGVLQKWLLMKVFQWTCVAWWGWVVTCIFAMCIPVFGYPLQLIITSLGKALLSPCAPLAEWAVRSFSTYGDQMFFTACADCGRILFVSCIFISIIELILAVFTVWVSPEEEKEGHSFKEKATMLLDAVVSPEEEKESYSFAEEAIKPFEIEGLENK